MPRLGQTLQLLLLAVITVLLAAQVGVIPSDALPQAASISDDTSGMTFSQAQRLDEYIRFNAPTADNVTDAGNHTQLKIQQFRDENDNNLEDIKQYADTINQSSDSMEQTIGDDGSAVTDFGRLKSSDLRTQLDYASQYQFNPERLRLFLNGDREFYQYNDYAASKFVDELDAYSLRPGGGDRMRIESAESATYIVGTTMTSSFAFSINQSLQGDDRIRVGPYTGTDGWYMEHRGNHSNDRTVDLFSVRDGERTLMKEDVVLPKPVTDWNRYEVTFNWYNVGAQRWVQTYTEDGEQVNERFASTSIDGERGPAEANLNAWYHVKADASTTGLEMDAGSIGFQVESGADQLVRGKPQRVDVSLPAGDDTWHPVYAIKLRDGTVVNARLNEFQALDYGNNAGVEVVAVSFDPSKTDASGFGVPGYHHEYNSQLRDTTNVSTVANSSGSVVDLGQGEKFGGWTISATSLEPSGNNFQSGASTSAQTTVKRQILASDVVVFLARSTSSGGDLTFDYVIEQDY